MTFVDYEKRNANLVPKDVSYQASLSLLEMKLTQKKGGISMGDKGRKDKNKHSKQVNKAKNAKNEAKKKKQEKSH